MQLYIELVEGAKDVKLLYPGKFNHGLYGNFEVSESDLQHAVDNFKNRRGVRLDETGGPELPANYQHSGGDRNPENAKAAGWIKSLYFKNDALWGVIEWTSKAIEYIKNKEFKYISPEFSHDWQDENGEKHGFTILGVALTNIPFLKKGLTAIAFTDDSIIVGEPLQTTNKNTGVKEMDEKVIRELMGLDDKADIQATIKQLQEKEKEASGRVKTLEDLNAELETKLTDAQAKIEETEKNLTEKEKDAKKLSEKVLAIEAQLKANEADQAITKFIEAGKIFPKQKEFWINAYLNDKQSTVSFLNDAPAVVKFEEQGTAGDAPEKQDDPTKEANDRAKKLMQEKNIDLKTAINQVFRDDPELKKSYFSYQN